MALQHGRISLQSSVASVTDLKGVDRLSTPLRICRTISAAAAGAMSGARCAVLLTHLAVLLPAVSGWRLVDESETPNGARVRRHLSSGSSCEHWCPHARRLYSPPHAFQPCGFFAARSDERTCDEGCDGSCDEGCGGLATSCDESCDAGCDACSYDESCDSHCDTCTDAVCPEGMHGAQSKSRVASAPTHASCRADETPHHSARLVRHILCSPSATLSTQEP